MTRQPSPFEAMLISCIKATTNAYAALHGAPEPFRDDMTPEHFAGLTEALRPTYSETNAPSFDYVPGLEDGPDIREDYEDEYGPARLTSLDCPYPNKEDICQE